MGLDAETLASMVQNDDALRARVEQFVLAEQERRHPRPIAADQSAEFFFSGLNAVGEVVEVSARGGSCRRGTVVARIDASWAVVRVYDMMYCAKSVDALWESNLTEDEAGRYG